MKSVIIAKGKLQRKWTESSVNPPTHRFGETNPSYFAGRCRRRGIYCTHFRHFFRQMKKKLLVVYHVPLFMFYTLVYHLPVSKRGQKAKAYVTGQAS